MNYIKIFLTIVLIECLSPSVHAAVRLPAIFQSNMVLQRDQEVSIWGFGDAGESVEVTFKGQTFETITNSKKKWHVTLPVQQAGGPYEILVQGKTNRIQLKNVLFGDVWICGGQSNMQYTISQIGYTPQENDTNRSKLRIFQAGIGEDYVPQEELSGGVWNVLSLESVERSSATAFFFGKFLQDSLQVPVGLISVNLGATSIETWMSPEALSVFPQFDDYYDLFLAPQKSAKTLTDAFHKIKGTWEADYYLKGKGLKEAWYRPETDVTDWKLMRIPTWWEDQGEPDFDGAIWFRKTFDLPENFEGDTLHLALNQIDDYDITWVNGHKVGETFGNQNWRNYKVPKHVLKPKDNVIVIRVFDIGGKGGLYSSAIWGNPILLGEWLYKPDYAIEADRFPKPHVVNINPFTSPSVLFNANIAPLTSLAVKGVIWYQGESNAARAEEYRSLFPALISDWRTHFNQPDLPFLFVQLANYGQEDTLPEPSTWAELREAQRWALRLEHTGMAAAIDIGEANDIHPKNKMDVGKRLGLAALQVAYGREIVSHGPVYKSMEIKDNKIIIHYQAGTNQLVSKNKYGYIHGFAVAGADHQFHWAKAFIKNHSVVVFSEAVPEPVAVRYAWSDNPGTTDLYNIQGLPAVPFRTDQLPWTTHGAEFSVEPWYY